MKKSINTFWGFLSEKWRHLTGGWEPFVEKPLPAGELDVLMHQASIPSWGFFFMLILSTAIATFGLLSNSAPTIIGAMIIAPLMAPMMGLAYGMAVLKPRQISRSILTMTSGAALVVLFAYLVTMWIGWRLAGSEILSRTTPTLLDLGVAMAAGAAAAFAYSRRSIMTSIAGVAIAVALVPPLVVCGIGLALGRKATADVGLSLSELGLYSGGNDIASGAFILFLANFAGIVVVAGAVLLSQGYGKWKRAVVVIVFVAACSALLLEPLGQPLHRPRVKSRAMRLIATLPIQHPDLFDQRGRIDSLHVTYRDGLLRIGIDGVVPHENLPGMQKKADLLRQYLSESIREPVAVELEVIPIEFVHFTSMPPDSQVSP
jgi:uncharacterized hydrophobic protein (TIGR00271 family)